MDELTSTTGVVALAGGPDMITKGSGNVVYQVDGATTTDNTYGNPFQRQNGGTNTFFDFETTEIGAAAFPDDDHDST